MVYLLLKFIHVLSATILFGAGLGTAFQMWTCHRRGDPAAIAVVARNTVRADWIFTATSGIVQPASGVALLQLSGYELRAPWLAASIFLYLLAGACWLVVVVIQIRVARIAEASALARAPLPASYFRLMRAWFWLGWPAFLALLAVIWLMVAKPQWG
jgi:uncharacterized membrane protein